MAYLTGIFNYFPRCVSQPPTKKINLLLLGLENSGKTTVAKGLVHELENGVVPTVGFSSVTLPYKKFSVVLYDLGGGPGIRAIWHKYFVDAHGIIFVLDSSDMEKVTECRGILKNLLTNEKLSGKPLLVLGNKQDIEGALDEIDLVESLHLEDLVNQQKCPTLVETCSALSLHKSQFKDDQIIQNSVKWLLSLIERDYHELNERVEGDMLLQKEIDKVELNRKIERVKEEKMKRGSRINENGAQSMHQFEANPRKGCHFDPFQPIGDLVDVKVENAHKSGCSNAFDTKVYDENVQVLDESRVKRRLNGKDGVCGELVSNSRRRVFNCFCCKSSNVANAPSSPETLSARRFCLWRSNKTLPLDPGGSGEERVSVWAVSLPSNERVELYDTAFSIPQAFTISPVTETTSMLKDFLEMKPASKNSLSHEGLIP